MDTADEKSANIKKQNPTMESVEYWWLKELVERITFGKDGQTLTVHWLCDKKTEVPTDYGRMLADLRSHESRERKAKAKEKMLREKTTTKVVRSKKANHNGQQENGQQEIG